MKAIVRATVKARLPDVEPLALSAMHSMPTREVKRGRVQSDDSEGKADEGDEDEDDVTSSGTSAGGGSRSRA